MGLAVRDALPIGARWAIQDVTWANGSSVFAEGGPQVLAQAATPDLFVIKDLVISRGRVFTEQDDHLGVDVVVIGTEIADRYFPNLDPIGRELRINHFPFQVVGLLVKQGTVFGLSLDRQVIAPFHSHMARIAGGHQDLYGVVVQAPDPSKFKPLEEIVREVMRKRRHLHPTEPDNFSFESSETALSQWLTIKKYLVLAGVILPAIGLVVGAIVIMNIMLVAVAERTREIGIRKSLGARRKDILRQFLAESATLSVVGAILGIALGVGLSQLIASVSPLPAAVAPWSIGLGVLIGAGVGITAGAYPASRASRLDPIAAMRQE